MSLVHGEGEFEVHERSRQKYAPRKVNTLRKAKGPRPRKSAVELDLEENGILGTGYTMPPAVKRNMGILVGTVLLLTVMAVIVALATWSVSDPSLSHATDAEPVNWLGYPGAVVADFLMQLTGFGSIALLFLLGLWAWRLAIGHVRRVPRTRIGAWLIGTVTLCGMVAVFPVAEGWPLPVGMGGYLGDLMLQPFQHFLGSDLGVLGKIVAGVSCALVGVLLFRYAAPDARPDAPVEDPGPEALGPEDLDDPHAESLAIAGAFATIAGGIAHWGLVTQMRVRRVLGVPGGRSGERADNFMRNLTADLREGLNDGSDEFLSDRDRQDRERDRLARATEAADGGRPISVERLRDATAPQRVMHDETDDFTDEFEDDLNDFGVKPVLDVPPDPRFDPIVENPSPDTNPGDPWPGFDQAIGSATETELARGTPVDGTQPPPPPRWRQVSGQPGEASGRPIAVAQPVAAPRTGRRVVIEAQTSFLKPENYELPPISLLSEPKVREKHRSLSDEVLTDNARNLESVLEDFGVRGEIINVRPGPVVTLYELEPAPGIKSSRVIGLADDIARSMSAISARVAVIPGKNAIGIELPNVTRETVFLRELVAAEAFEKTKAKLALCLGKTIGGEAVIADLARMPHLLVAGTTGSGKSVAVNTMILSLLYRYQPDRCKLIMIDPKMLELSVYDGIPHLLTPVVTDSGKAVVALKWTVCEMEDRYRKMSKLGVRNIDGFNTRISQAIDKGEEITRTVQTGFDPETGEAVFEEEALALKPMPYIVVIVDEMADLMMVAGKDIEGAIQRLAQMARAAGIHLIMATQRPSVDVITGTIKANFPTRISFQVTSKIDSRTILGEQGAEQLLGQGDMLYMAGGGRIQRVHGPFVADEEVEDIVAHLKSQAPPDYLDGVTDGFEAGDSPAASEPASGGSESNDLYDKAVAIVLRDKKASTSYVQRRLSIGYNRAASLIERMEQEGVISAANHAGKREVLVGDGVD